MSQNNPKITVIIPTFNRAHFLEECLNSILSQTLSPTQIIVVNNGSIDQTQKICQSYGDKIEYYEIGQVGKSGAVNFGFKKVTGDYIWIFDDDDVALPDALERLVEPLKNNPDLGFSYSSIFYTETNLNNNKLGEVICQTHEPNLDKGFLIALLERSFLIGATIFAKTSCYKIVGDFDTSLLRSQDYEMAIRIAKRFKGAWVTGGPTYHLRQHRGIRGSKSIEIKPDKIKEEWLKYDQQIFKKLYETLPLSDYLPPGISLNNNKRQAILQRIYIMSSKQLYSQLIQDLQTLSLIDDQSSLSRMEDSIAKDIIFKKFYYNNQRLFEYKPFLHEIRNLATYSNTIRIFRFNLMWTIGTRFKNKFLRLIKFEEKKQYLKKKTKNLILSLSNDEEQFKIFKKTFLK